MSFWHNLPKYFTVLAPMEEVTDTVFRQVVQSCGRPNVMFTEFTSCEGIQSVGQSKVIHRLKYDEQERPIVAQVWGITPEDYFKTAKLIYDLGFDGIDVNMGCPVKKIIKKGACSALIKNPNLAKEIILATKEGAKNLPVSIKTRIGFSNIDTENWCSFLLSECKPSILTVHGRTVKEESKVPNHWDEIAKVVNLRNQIQENLSHENQTLIVGNGDIQTLNEANLKAKTYGLDGIMIGRGVLKNPWIFNSLVQIENVTKQQRLEKLLFHLKLWQETWLGTRPYPPLKRFFKVYINGFVDAAELRARLMETKSVEEAIGIVRES